jgi:hypothetical protein
VNRQQVLNLIYERLSRTLHLTGFKLNRKAEGFVRRIPQGRQEIGVPLTDYNPLFRFSLVICIRLDPVEEVFHLFSGALPKDQSLSSTSITRLSYFGCPQQSFDVSEPTDIETAFELLDPLVKTQIVPLLDNTQSVAVLERRVNDEAGFDITRHPPKGMHGVILAHLTKNPNWEALVHRYQQEMASFAPDVREEYERLVEHLREGTPQLAQRD